MLGQKATMVRKSDIDSMNNIGATDFHEADGTYTMVSYEIESPDLDNDSDATNSYDVAMNLLTREKETQSYENEEKDHDSFIYVAIGENGEIILPYAVAIEEQTCVREGFFPNPEDCSKFYRCAVVGLILIKYEFSCPPGTLWDDQKITCNFPDQIRNLGTCKFLENLNIAESVKFLTPRIEDSSTIGDLSRDRFSIVCPSGFRRHSKYCNLFYQCIVNNEMQVIIFGCPDGTIFDQEKLLCVDLAHDCTKFEFDKRPSSITIVSTFLSLSFFFSSFRTKYHSVRIRESI